MCLAAFALGCDDRFPFVLAANRDELFARPAAPLDWWRPAHDGPRVLAGRDLSAGGAWLGLNEQGRLALLTNIRAGTPPAMAAGPSRGTIVTGWLTSPDGASEFAERTAGARHGGFNLVAADFAQGTCHWFSSQRAEPLPLEPGLYGLSNGTLDEPWPKVRRLREDMAGQLRDGHDTIDDLATALLDRLGDSAPAPDGELPDTGVPREMERMLSPIFIRSPDGRYGTRCSTVVITERLGRTTVTHVFERSYDSAARPIADRRVVLTGWPPAPTR